MKKLMAIIMSAALLTPMLAFANVAAEDSTSSSSTGSGTSTTSTTTKPNDTSGSDSTSDTSTDLQTRLTERKTELKTKLTELESKHLQAVCKNAQGKATSTSEKVKGLSTSRTKIYSNITTNLNDLVTKLQAQKVDVTDLQSQVKTLQGLIDTFNTDMTAYKQAVSDLVAMDCTSDPTAFQASLLTARQARDKALTDSTAIKTYTQNTLKPTLQKIRDQLAKTEDSSSTSDDKTTDTTKTNTTNTTTNSTTSGGKN